jgi:MinD superfamily P-loop ATPase
LIIAVLSGKGGTGKTTVAASLAQVIPSSQYVDCDVEEPNGFLFFNPQITETTEVSVLIPEIDQDLCSLCGACAKICQFSAIAVTPKKVMVFPELCHHCGACALACQRDAITEIERTIGVVENDDAHRFIQGRLHVGEPVGLPIITALKKRINMNRTAILDCSPGASCAVVRSIEDCDYALLVTEPTPFGLHDLKIAVALVKKMGIQAGIILNKSGLNDQLIDDYCQQEALPVLMKIPFSREIAENYSRGILPASINSDWQTRFTALYWRIGQEVMS